MREVTRYLLIVGCAAGMALLGAALFRLALWIDEEDA